MPDFKNFKNDCFENIKVKGMFEWRIKPIELIVNVTFSVIPILNGFNQEQFSRELGHRLSLGSIDKAIKSLPPKGWHYDGSRYTYGHDFSEVRLEDHVSSLGLDLYFIQQDKTHCVEDFYSTISQQIAELKNFKSSEHFVIRPSREHRPRKKYED